MQGETPFLSPLELLGRFVDGRHEAAIREMQELSGENTQGIEALSAGFVETVTSQVKEILRGGTHTGRADNSAA